MNTRTSLITITTLTATFVALCAAVFSITGIAKLFAGASISAAVMASSLELGKIVSISFLYQYWEKIPRLLKTYLSIASFVLMIITSAGIYGFLTAAYQKTADQVFIMDRQTEVIDLKKQRFQDELAQSIQERDRVSTSIQELNRGLANNVVQVRDPTTGQILTSTSAGTRTALQRQLTDAAAERTRLSERIESLSESVTSLDIQSVEIVASNDIAAEVGPLRFVSELTGWEMSSVINIFALLIVIVFDPLAIALVISVNFLLKQKNEENELSETITNIPTKNVTPTHIHPDDIGTPLTDVVSTEQRHDPQYFTRGDFDWSKTETWENNPIAVNYYNLRVKPRLKNTLDK